jgi:protoheme IX farnesyltransferase
MKHIGLLLELGKVRIASLATLSMVTGFILASGGVRVGMILPTIGVFLLACGASALNQIQDRDIDALMQRTMGRPIPSGRVDLLYAGSVSAACIIVGSLLVLVGSNLLAMELGLLAVCWYNLVYTPLKRISAFAAVPGGVVGAIPPMIGWVAAGGYVFDPRILAVAFFFFMWQIPHFWLLVLFSCARDYEKAGLPSLTRYFSIEQLSRITFAWILGTAVACLAIPLFGIIEGLWINLGLAAAGVWLVWRSARILHVPGGFGSFRFAFKQINMYVFWVISLLSLSGFLR